MSASTVGASYEANFGALQQRVSGLESAITGVANQVSALASKIDQRGETNWPVIVGMGGFFLSVVIAIGTLAYLPIREGINRSDNSIARLVDTTITRSEFAVSFAAGSQRRDDLQRFNEDRFKRLEKDSDDVQKALVPRGEHEQRYAAIAQRESDLQRQIDEAKKALDGTYNLRDAMQDMRRKIDFLERRAGDGPGKP